MISQRQAKEAIELVEAIAIADLHGRFLAPLACVLCNVTSEGALEGVRIRKHAPTCLFERARELRATRGRVREKAIRGPFTKAERALLRLVAHANHDREDYVLAGPLAGVETRTAKRLERRKLVYFAPRTVRLTARGEAHFPDSKGGAT